MRMAPDGHFDIIQISHLGLIQFQMKQLTRSYHYEAKCFYKGYVPTVEEYMEHALITAALIYFGTSSFVGITGDLVTKQSLDWISNNPLFIKAGSLICRLLDDMVEFEVCINNTLHL